MTPLDLFDDPVDGAARLVTRLGRHPAAIVGVPLALAWALLVQGPRAAAAAGAPRWARLLRAVGAQALGGAAADLTLTAAQPLLRLAFPPVRGAFFFLFCGRLSLTAAALALAGVAGLGRRDLGPPAAAWLERGLWAAHGAFGALVLYATYDGQHLGTTRLRLAYPHRPRLPPLRVAQVSDIHMERLTRRDEAAIARLRAAAPDLICLTGDFVNIDRYDARAYEDLRAWLQAVAALRPRYGVYACLGNVDPPAITRATFLGTGITLLENTAVTLDVAGRRVQILGAGSSRGHRWEYDLPNFQAALGAAAAQGPADFRILLFHTPDLAPQAAAAGVDLYLCGHTHGGQIRLPVVGALRTGSRFGRRYVMGLHRLANGGYIYTNRGLGFEGMDLPRIRVLCPPEVVLIDLCGRDQRPTESGTYVPTETGPLGALRDARTVVH